MLLKVEGDRAFEVDMSVCDRSDAAAVMMSSLSEEDTIVSTLEIGADDYLVKPFGCLTSAPVGLTGGFA